jgi:predicted transcriptional regulator
MDLMASLKFVQAYIDDFLMITRGILDDHLKKMETILTRQCDAILKINAAKSLFCTHKIEYLGYILVREGIKCQPKKVQAILTLNLPNNVKELRHFLRMVQCYQDICEMLAPLTDLVGECKEMMTTKKNKTKKKPWR